MECNTVMGWDVNQYVVACQELEINPEHCTLLFINSQWYITHGAESPKRCIYDECECCYNEIERKFKDAEDDKWT